jgi:hypothetical protein
LVVSLDLIFLLDLVLSIDLVLRLGPALSLGSGLALAGVTFTAAPWERSVEACHARVGCVAWSSTPNALSAGQPLIMA